MQLAKPDPISFPLVFVTPSVFASDATISAANNSHRAPAIVDAGQDRNIPPVQDREHDRCFRDEGQISLAIEQRLQGVPA